MRPPATVPSVTNLGDPSAPIRLVVLFGGQSAEHDVSCVSARHVLAAADTERFRVEPVGITRAGEWVQAADVSAALTQGADALPESLTATGTSMVPTRDLAPVSADETVVVFPVLHGPMGEDGTVQGMLELAGVPYVGTGVLGSALCMDKIAAKEMADRHGIAQARYRSLHADQIADPALIGEIAAELAYPMFIKPANLGSSVGVSKADNPGQFTTALELAATYDEWIIVEEAIVGREIELAVLGNLRSMEASVPGEIIPGDTFYSYGDKYHDGVAEAVVPADLPADVITMMQAAAVEAAQALRVEGLARVDFFYDDRPDGRGLLLNEINTMPGFTPISMYPKLWEASGLGYSDLITKLVMLAIERHNRRAAHRSVEH